jgi:K(+)-stimulated pyrophosphate-energized sodium pump
VGFLLGGAVPFLFSSMLLRAVSRAAFYIVKECRAQFRDIDIWQGNKKPDYGRVVDICTSTAQKELIGPGFLAIGSPILIGFLLGPYALGGFLAGTILTGQLLAVFMSNAGGAKGRKRTRPPSRAIRLATPSRTRLAPRSIPSSR